MKTKLSFARFSKLISSLSVILLSLFCFPKLNIIFILSGSDISTILLCGIPAIAFILSIVAFFVLKNDLPLFDRLSPLILLFILFAVFLVESIYNYYDPESLSLIFNIIAGFGLIISIYSSVYWMKNLKLATQEVE